MLMTNVRIETASEICRPSWARSPEPRRSTSTPPTMGNQIKTLSSGQLIDSLAPKRLHPRALGPKYEPTGKRRQPDDQRERVVVEVAGLEVPAEHGQHADEPRRAVHGSAVDDRLIADLPEQIREPAAPARDDVLVEPVEVVLVDEHVVEPVQLRHE